MRHPWILLPLMIVLTSATVRGAEPVSPDPMKFRTTDGREFELSQLRGKAVLVEFWATWCGPCLREAFGLKPLYDKYRGEGFEIIGVYCDEGAGTQLKTFLEKTGMTWPQHIDGKQGPLATRYGITAIPANFLFGRDGRLIAKNVHDKRLEPAIRFALGLPRLPSGSP